MAPLINDEAYRSMEYSSRTSSASWLAMEITLATLGVAFTILLSALICGCCGNDDGSKNQPSKKPTGNSIVAPPPPTSPASTPVHPSSSESASSNRPKSNKSQMAHATGDKSAGVASLDGSILKNSKLGSTKGSIAPAGKDDSKKAQSSDVVDFAPEGDPRYRSMAELDGSGK